MPPSRYAGHGLRVVLIYHSHPVVFRKLQQREDRRLRAGVFTVSAVRARDNIVRLRDADGRSADVYVDPDVFDLSTLEAGDQVGVDFFVPEEADDRLEAASIWKL